MALSLPVCMAIVGCNHSNTSGDASTVSSSDARSATANVDNSAKNARDQDNATLTPGDQGNSPSDREITRNVRQAIVGGKNDYSVTAKNIKIITVGGRVTLRGPVKTDAEKAGIEHLAKSVAGDANVDNQLEVKANP